MLRCLAEPAVADHSRMLRCCFQFVHGPVDFRHQYLDMQVGVRVRVCHVRSWRVADSPFQPTPQNVTVYPNFTSTGASFSLLASSAGSDRALCGCVLQARRRSPARPPSATALPVRDAGLILVAHLGPSCSRHHGRPRRLRLRARQQLHKSLLVVDLGFPGEAHSRADRVPGQNTLAFTVSLKPVVLCCVLRVVFCAAPEAHPAGRRPDEADPVGVVHPPAAAAPRGQPLHRGRSRRVHHHERPPPPRHHHGGAQTIRNVRSTLLPSSLPLVAAISSVPTHPYGLSLP